MTEGPLVRFDGVCTAHEQWLVGQAVARVESTCNMKAVPEVFGPPWLVVVEEVGGGRRLFFASRIGEPSALAGETVEELVGNIQRTFAGGTGFLAS